MSQQLADQNRQLVETDLQRLQVLRDQKKAVEEQIKSQQDAIKSAQDAQKSVHQRFSELNPYQQGELKRITEKTQNGEDLSEREIRFLKRTQGFGSQVVRDYEAKKGIAAGSEPVAAALGDGYSDLKRRETEARRRLTEEEKKKRDIEAQQPAAVRDLQEDNRRRDAANAGQVDAHRYVDRRILAQQVRQEAEDDVEPEVGFWGALGSDLYNASPFGTFDREYNKYKNIQDKRRESESKKNNDFGQPAPQRQPEEQPAVDAADQVTQSGIGVENGFKIVLDAVLTRDKSILDLIEKSELMKGYYNV